MSTSKSIVRDRMVACGYSVRTLRDNIRANGHKCTEASVQRWVRGASPKDKAVRRIVIDLLRMSEIEALAWLAPKGAS